MPSIGVGSALDAVRAVIGMRRAAVYLKRREIEAVKDRASQ